VIRACSLALCSLVALGASAWAWQAQSATAVDASPIELDGSELFTVKGCASCHTGPNTVARMGEFPPLDAVATWAGDRRPGIGAADYVAESIRTPSVFRSPAWHGGGPIEGMPDLGLTEAEIHAITEYLLQG
jgi:mono/diheme cytochrome c family protein